MDMGVSVWRRAGRGKNRTADGVQDAVHRLQLRDLQQYVGTSRISATVADAVASPGHESEAGRWIFPVLAGLSDRDARSRKVYRLADGQSIQSISSLDQFHTKLLSSTQVD